MNLLEIRHAIYILDAEIIGLLSKRSSPVSQAGRLKDNEARERRRFNRYGR